MDVWYKQLLWSRRGCRKVLRYPDGRNRGGGENPCRRGEDDPPYCWRFQKSCGAITVKTQAITVQPCRRTGSGGVVTSAPANHVLDTPTPAPAWVQGPARSSRCVFWPRSWGAGWSTIWTRSLPRPSGSQPTPAVPVLFLKQMVFRRAGITHLCQTRDGHRPLLLEKPRDGNVIDGR